MGGMRDGREDVARIQGDPNYQALVKERSSFGWTLAIIMLVLYYGFIAIVAFDPAPDRHQGQRRHHRRHHSWAPALIVASVLLTGIYVIRANSRYDDLTRAIVASATGGAR